jgi:hypothetical protein
MPAHNLLGRFAPLCLPANFLLLFLFLLLLKVEGVNRFAGRGVD